MKEGIEVSGGQTVRYLITDAENRRASKRVKAAELINASRNLPLFLFWGGTLFVIQRKTRIGRSLRRTLVR